MKLPTHSSTSPAKPEFPLFQVSTCCRLPAPTRKRTKANLDLSRGKFKSEMELQLEQVLPHPPHECTEAKNNSKY